MRTRHKRYRYDSGLAQEYRQDGQQISHRDRVRSPKTKIERERERERERKRERED